MSLTNPKHESFVRPYSKLAAIYDEVMSHVDYNGWSYYIQKVIQKWHPHAKRILDISCGTASLLLKLDSTKYQFFGFDFSYSMLKVAAKKCKALDRSIHLWQGNMTSFRLNQKVDVVLSLYDSVNYIREISAWNSMFECAYDVLNNNGLFIFDICTEKNSKKYFHNYYESKFKDGYSYSRHSQYDMHNKIHSNRFEIQFGSEKTVFVELHEQKIVSLNEVMNIISTTRFRFLGAFHGFGFRRGTEKSLRIHFVLKKTEENDSTI